MQPHILVTGATGNVGAELVKQLQNAGIAFRAGVTHPDSAREKLGTDIDLVHFDFLDSTTYTSAFIGIEQMFLVRPPALANVKRDIAPAVRAAVDAGVRQIVFLSIQGVENNRIVPHHKIEQLILELDVDYTFLRCGFFMQNLSTTHRDEIRDRDEIALPVGKARTSFIDVRDIAAVALKTLTEEGHARRSYTLTGAEALDYYEVAAKLSSVLDRPIVYKNPSPFSFLRQQLSTGQKLGYALVVTGLYTITRFGNAETVSDDVTRILGRTPISFDQFAQDYRAAWTQDTQTR